MTNTIVTETLLIKSDFEWENAVTCPAGQYTEIAKVQVPDENIWRFGAGNKKEGIDDRGTMTVTLANSSGNAIHGKIRFKSRDRGSIQQALGQAPRTEILANGKNISPEDAKVGAIWRKFLVLEFEPDTNSTVAMNNAGTVLEVPVTKMQNPDFR